jgi:small subunit ribosomal protein S19
MITPDFVGQQIIAVQRSSICTSLRNRKHGRSQIREFSPTRSFRGHSGAKNKGKNKKQWSS